MQTLCPTTSLPDVHKTNVTATVASKSPHQPTISVQATVAILNSLTNKHLLFFKKVQDTTQADTGRQAGGHRQASSQTSRQTYWQAGGRLAGGDRHASQHVSGQHKRNPRASGYAEPFCLGLHLKTFAYLAWKVSHNMSFPCMV